MTAYVKIQTITGHDHVKAELYGPFAIHPTNGIPGGSWTLTHKATGFAVEHGIVSRHAAFSLARKLVAARVNWQFTDANKIPQRTKAAGLRVREAWRKSGDVTV